MVSRHGHIKQLPNNKDFENPPSLELDEPYLYNKISSHHEQDALPGITHYEIKQGDNASNISSRGHGSKSRTSNISTTSACVKAEADMAVLARQRLLKGKHNLEQQEEGIRKRKE